MKIHRRSRTPLKRQLGEALNIAKAGGPGSVGVMNQKEEYSRCVVPELEVSEGWRDSAKRNREPDSQADSPPQQKRTSTAGGGMGITATRHPKEHQEHQENNEHQGHKDNHQQQEQQQALGNPAGDGPDTQNQAQQQQQHQQEQRGDGEGGTTATRHPQGQKNSSPQVQAQQPVEET